jgi:exonuclease III
MIAMKSPLVTAFTSIVVTFAAVQVRAEFPVRVASYNIYFLRANISNAREANLRQVIATLGADVIGLQEIQNRAALERIFDPEAWSLVIDEESDDVQDLAVAVRKPLEVRRRNGSTFDLDADDEDFLFPGSGFESPYPNRRDCLCILIKTPNDQGEFFLMVNHWKSRLGGRSTTDTRREEAARLLASKIEHEFDGKNLVVVGDMNDNPDDKSLNILESGNPTAIGGPEQQNGPLLVNVGDELVTKDIVTWGAFVDENGTLVKVIPGSQDQNNQTRGTPGSAAPILFDHILFPVHMLDQYVPGSAAVFSEPVARQGNGLSGSTASDHLPILADFVIRNPDETEPPPMPGSAALRIVELMPNPASEDAGNEFVILRNTGTTSVDLAGWKLRDRSDNEWSISGTVQANGTLKLIDSANKMPLNNNGDEIVLLNAQGQAVHRVSYGRNEVTTGQAISVP